MPIIQSISDHRAAVEALPAASLYNALENNNVYKLQKTTSSGTIECYIKITDKTPLLFPNTSTIYDCSITGPAVYLEISSSGDIKTGEIGIRTISNLMSNKTHTASDNWIVYTSSASEYNTKVDLVIDNVSAGTTSGSSGEITSVSDHWTAVRNLPASVLYNGLIINNIYKLRKTSDNKIIECYIKLTDKIATAYPNSSDVYDCSITGPSVYVEKDTSGNITVGEIGIRTISNLISNKTHIASDNWLIYTSSIKEYNFMVDEVVCYMSYTPENPNHLSFTSKQNGSTIYLQAITQQNISFNIEYSYDAITWMPWPHTSTNAGSTFTHTFSQITLNYNERIYVRSQLNTLNTDSSMTTYTKFYMSGVFAANGNIQSLINYSETVPEFCYLYLFQDCTSLISAPKLPAKTIARSSYRSMFRGCTNLITAPELPATILADYCYTQMFQDCSSLTTASDLPATLMSDYCYGSMFRGCISLTQPPKILATALDNYCFNAMFYGCTNLTDGADLQRSTAPTNIRYYCTHMYNGCSHLNRATTPNITSWSNNNFTNWLLNVASSGILYKPNGLTNITTNSPNGIPTGWSAAEHHTQLHLSAKGSGNLGFSCNLNGIIYNISQGDEITIPVKRSDSISIIASSSNVIKAGNDVLFVGSNSLDYDSIVNKTITCVNAIDQNPLCFTSNAPGSIISMTHYGNNQSSTKPVIYTSLNGGPFSLWDFSNITLSTGDKLYVYGDNATIGRSSTNYSIFNITGQVSASGNIQSLVSFQEIISQNYCFFRLFRDCTGLTSAPELPATILSGYCYEYMFQGCTSLATAPELPATTITAYCYAYMFSGCTSLTSAPELPATTTTDHCYEYMFQDCTSLTTAPELPATTTAVYCYAYMFSGCTSLTIAPELPATTLTNYCYQYMFNGCSSLISPPALPATTLANYCYRGLFYQCTSLDIVPDLPATTLANSCYTSMFYRCTNLTATTILPATTLTSGCYSNMFQYCSQISHIIVSATSWNTSNTTNWVYGVAATGTFEKPSATNIPTGANGIPSGWTVINN